MSRNAVFLISRASALRIQIAAATLKFPALNVGAGIRFYSSDYDSADRYYKSRGRGSSYGGRGDRKYGRSYESNSGRLNYLNDSSDLASSFNRQQFKKEIIYPEEEMGGEITLDSLKEEGAIDEMLYKAVKKMNFPSLTPVQQKTIKPILNNETEDVIARAKTGTGKTFSFLLPIFEHLVRTKKEHPDMVKSVIVAPTRDLALQIEEEVRKLYQSNSGLRKFGSVSMVGGTNYGKALNNMQRTRPNIVIGTPGRLMQLIDEYGPEYFEHVDFKVLDEADRLLDIGFKDDLEFISSLLNKLNDKGPEHIRTLLFSATLDDKVQMLANNIMNKEKCLYIDTVDKNEPDAHENIDQSVVISEKFSGAFYAAFDHIQRRVGSEEPLKAIIFTPTVKSTVFVSRVLSQLFRNRIPILEFHGKIEQKRRTNLVKKFKETSEGILICTDVGARGMDFKDVTEVLQIGIPTEFSNYTHRIGRTARAGKTGSSVLFISKSQTNFLKTLEKEKNIVIEKRSEFEPTEEQKKSVAECIKFESDVYEAIMSTISSYRGSAKEYNFEASKIFPDLAQAYGELLNQPEKKITISSRESLQKIGFARSSYALEMFELKGDAAGLEDFLRRQQDSEFFEQKFGYKNSSKRGNRFSSNSRNVYGTRGRDYGNNYRGYGNNNRGYGNNNRGYGRKSYDRNRGTNPSFD